MGNYKISLLNKNNAIKWDEALHTGLIGYYKKENVHYIATKEWSKTYDETLPYLCLLKENSTNLA